MKEEAPGEKSECSSLMAFLLPPPRPGFWQNPEKLERASSHCPENIQNFLAWIFRAQSFARNLHVLGAISLKITRISDDGSKNAQRKWIPIGDSNSGSCDEKLIFSPLSSTCRSKSFISQHEIFPTVCVLWALSQTDMTKLVNARAT